MYVLKIFSYICMLVQVGWYGNFNVIMITIINQKATVYTAKRNTWFIQVTEWFTGFNLN